MSCWKLVLLELSSSVGVEKSVPIFAFWVAVYILLSPFVALGYWLAPNGMQVAVGDVIYIEANSGAVKRVGRCDSFATEYDLEAEEYVPIPKGEVHKKKEIVQVPLWCYFNLKFHFRKRTFHNLKNEVIITGTSGGSARGVGHAVASSQPMHVPCKITVFVPRWLGSSIDYNIPFRLILDPPLIETVYCRHCCGLHFPECKFGPLISIDVDRFLSQICWLKAIRTYYKLLCCGWEFYLQNFSDHFLAIFMPPSSFLLIGRCICSRQISI